MAYIAHEQNAVNGIYGLGLPTLDGYMKQHDPFENYLRSPLGQDNLHPAQRLMGNLSATRTYQSPISTNLAKPSLYGSQHTNLG